ncbi:MAG TPA: hypothetical protein VFM15_09370 [Gammaproteobacteria bacterium]|nr:hypothetical protein [Gammaproteobacteria bacterium]
MPLLPARMVNEYQYCPRLAYLEWVQGEWADSADTVEGCARSEASPELLKNHVQRGLAATPASTPR